MTGISQPTGSLQDLVNNSISPFYIKKEIIEREDEEGDMDMEDTERPEMVGVFLPSFEQPEPGTLSEDEGRQQQFDIFAENSGERAPAPNKGHQRGACSQNQPQVPRGARTARQGQERD